MTDWLHPALDAGTLATLAEQYRANRHVRIPDVLHPDRAAELLASMGEIGEWMLLCATEAGTAVIDPTDARQWTPDRQADLQKTLLGAARQGIGFAYLAYRMHERWKAGPPDTPLGRFHTALAGPEILGLVEAVTGHEGLGGTSAQLTRFGPSHYLTRHRDDPATEGRRLAFVWGFTPQWHPDWGGLLQFYTDDGAPTRAFAPGFNTLDLFEIDHVHAVTYITPFAGGIRQAVSGWYLDAETAAA